MASYMPYPMAYGQQFQPMIPQAQYQPTIPTPTAAPIQGISGRIISSFDEIAPNDVPMDGTTAYFPMKDGSTIFARAWNRDGSIATVRYAPVADVQDDVQQGPTLADIVDQLNDIQDMLKPKPAQKRSTAKKEVDE